MFPVKVFDLPQGPRSAEPCWSQAAWRAAALSGGFRLSFLITFLPYTERWMDGWREKERRRKRETLTSNNLRMGTFVFCLNGPNIWSEKKKEIGSGSNLVLK